MKGKVIKEMVRVFPYGGGEKIFRILIPDRKICIDWYYNELNAFRRTGEHDSDFIVIVDNVNIPDALIEKAEAVIKAKEELQDFKKEFDIVIEIAKIEIDKGD